MTYQCEAIKANGQRCRGRAMQGARYCGPHLDHPPLSDIGPAQTSFSITIGGVETWDEGIARGCREMGPVTDAQRRRLAATLRSAPRHDVDAGRVEARPAALARPDLHPLDHVAQQRPLTVEVPRRRRLIKRSA